MPNKWTKGWSKYRLRKYEMLRKQGQPKSEAAAVSADIEKMHRRKRGLSMTPPAMKAKKRMVMK